MRELKTKYNPFGEAAVFAVEESRGTIHNIINNKGILVFRGEYKMTSLRKKA